MYDDFFVSHLKATIIQTNNFLIAGRLLVCVVVLNFPGNPGIFFLSPLSGIWRRFFGDWIQL